MRRPVVAGNWKMHGSRAENAQLVRELTESDGGGLIDVIVCPPFVYLWEVSRLLRES